MPIGAIGSRLTGTRLGVSSRMEQGEGHNPSLPTLVSLTPPRVQYGAGTVSSGNVRMLKARPLSQTLALISGFRLRVDAPHWIPPNEPSQS